MYLIRNFHWKQFKQMKILTLVSFLLFLKKQRII